MKDSSIISLIYITYQWSVKLKFKNQYEIQTRKFRKVLKKAEFFKWQNKKSSLLFHISEILVFIFFISFSDDKKIILSDIQPWTVCIDRDVAGGTSVKQGTDEKFQDWNLSVSSAFQPWGREKATQPCAVNLPADIPQALSASMPIPLQWLVL